MHSFSSPSLQASQVKSPYSRRLVLKLRLSIDKNSVPIHNQLCKAIVYSEKLPTQISFLKIFLS